MKAELMFSFFLYTKESCLLLVTGATNSAKEVSCLWKLELSLKLDTFFKELYINIKKNCEIFFLIFFFCINWLVSKRGYMKSWLNPQRTEVFYKWGADQPLWGAHGEVAHLWLICLLWPWCQWQNSLRSLTLISYGYLYPNF